MSEHINQIIALNGGAYACLQSLHNDTNAEGERIAGNSYYVGYRCTNAEDATPLEGEQPGQVYLTGGIASADNAPTDMA